MLTGIAARNSILLVAYAVMARKERGLSRNEALLDAARDARPPDHHGIDRDGVDKAPIAIGIGADAEFRVPMAIAVIGGDVNSVVPSLVYVPAVDSIMDGVRRVPGKALGRLLPRQEPSSAAIAAGSSECAVAWNG